VLPSEKASGGGSSPLALCKMDLVRRRCPVFSSVVFFFSTPPVQETGREVLAESQAILSLRLTKNDRPFSPPV